MIGNTLTDQTGRLIKPLVSSYQPSSKVADLTLRISKDYQTGLDIQTRPFKEFNDVSLLRRMDEDKKLYNIYVQPASDNPDDSWRWNGVSPMTHNKVISMAAHFVAATLYPAIYAQNNQDEQDKLAAEVMKYLREWNIKNSDYEMSYLYAIVSALINPVAYLEIDYTEAVQQIRILHENGEVSFQEAVDEILSGLQINNVPADELFIANPYQFYLQRQRFIIRRRFIDYDELKSKYGKYANWKYIQPGVKTFYGGDNNTFYDQRDIQLSTLGEEVIYKNRLEDIEVPYVNGIYFGKPNIQANIIRHRDNFNRPKYNISKLGFQPIDEKRFFFYRSAIMNMATDQKLRDKLVRMVVDGTFLKLFPPLIGIGTGRLDSNVIFPGSTTNLPMGSRAEALQIGSDLGAGINALKLNEESIDESSQSRVMEGQLSTEQKTAYEIGRAEKNARVQLSIFGKMLSSFVTDFGELMNDVIIQHQSVGEAEELLGGEIKLKFRTFLLADQTEKGRKISRKITFKPELMGREFTEAQKEKESFKVLKRQGGRDSEKKLYEVNPDVFQKLKFKVYLDADSVMESVMKNDALELEKKARFYDRAMVNPFTDKKAITRDYLVEPEAKGETDKYMAPEGPQQEIASLARLIGGRSVIPPATLERSLSGLLPANK